MKRSTLRRGTVVAAAAILIAAWLLLRDRAGPDGRREDAPPSARPPAAPVERESPAPPAADPSPAAFDPSVSGGNLGSAAAEPKPPPARRVVVEGKVLGLGDEPVPGASVNLLLPAPEEDDRMGPEPFDVPPGSVDVFELMAEGTTAGEDGSFRIDTPARVRAGLIAWGGAYANTLVPPFSLEHDVRGLVLRMEPAVALTGRVMESAVPDLGHPPGPIAGAYVSLLQRQASGTKVHLRTELTKEDGSFRTWGWTPGTYELRVRAARFLEKRQEVGLPAEGLDVRLVPSRHAPLTGRVWLPGGAGPAAGARVRARLSLPGGNWDDSWETAETDAEGRYRIERLWVSTTPAKGALMVEADAGEKGVGKAVLLSWSGTDELNIDLLPAPAAALRVRVLDGTRGSGREPVAGVRLVARGGVQAPASAAWPIQVERSAVTDAQGVAEFRRLPEKHVFLFVAEDEWTWEIEGGKPRSAGEPRADGSWDTEIDVQRRGRVRGLVTGPGGEPVEGAHVEVINDGWPRAAPSAARTGADGRFTLDGVTAQARFRLRATAHGYEPYESYQMSATPGASLDDVLLPLPAATESFLGRVVDERGIPRPEVHVCIRPALPGIGAEAGGGEAWTGTGGRYRVEVRAGYAWEVLVAMKGFDGTPSAPFRAGETVPDLVLRPVEAAPK